MCDCGRGIGPRADSPGLGLGLSLMARLADGLAIAPNRSLNGTRVSAMFRDVAPAGATSRRRAARRRQLDDYVAALDAAMLAGDSKTLKAAAEQALDRADRLRAEHLL